MLAAAKDFYLVVDALLWAGAEPDAKNNVRASPRPLGSEDGTPLSTARSVALALVWQSGATARKLAAMKGCARSVASIAAAGDAPDTQPRRAVTPAPPPPPPAPEPEEEAPPVQVLVVETPEPAP